MLRTLTSRGSLDQKSWFGNISQPVAPLNILNVIIPPMKYIPVTVKKRISNMEPVDIPLCGSNLHPYGDINIKYYKHYYTYI